MSQGLLRFAPSLLGLLAAAASLDCGGTSSPSISSQNAGPSYPVLDGASPVVWSDAPFGGTAVIPHGVSLASDGTIRVAGTLSGEATIGANTLGSAGGTDVLLSSLDAAGNVLWARNYGDAKDQSATSAIVDGQGNVIVAGTFAGTLDLRASAPVLESVTTSQIGMPGTSPITAVGFADAFVAKLDPLGNLLWSTHLGSTATTTQARSLAMAANGTIALTGAFQSSREHGIGAPYAFVTLFDQAGNLQWDKSFGGEVAATGTSIAFGPKGDVLVSGTYEGAVDFGTGPLPTYGGLDVFVADLSAQGATVWSEGFGGPLDDEAVGVAFDAAGNFITLGNYTSSGDEHPIGRILVTKYSPSRSPLWSQRFGDANTASATALAVDSQGDVYLAGQVQLAFPFGACILTPTSADASGQAFVGKIDASGNAICGQRYGLGASAEILSMVVDPLPGLLMAGDFQGAIDLGQGTATAGATAGFVAREQPLPQPLQ
jgi:hypothetical protein